MQGHQLGTSFGNTVLRRYLQNTEWVQDATSPDEMRKFEEYVRYFQKYAAEYDFDYLMLVAQGYEESGLDQNRKNPSGAVGIMQVIPKYAAASPINISDVGIAENNIEAGAKMLHNIAETYFHDDKLETSSSRADFAGDHARHDTGATRPVQLADHSPPAGQGNSDRARTRRTA